MNQLLLNQFYTEKSNFLTLEQALEKHYQLNPRFTRWDDYPTKLTQETMKSHDIMHIVFGCDTYLPGEFRVELLTFLCSNLSLKEYSKMVSNSEINKKPFEIAKKIGYSKVAFVMFSRIWYLPYTFYVSKRMIKKWPVLEIDTLMHKTIGELRTEYGIQILHKS